MTSSKASSSSTSFFHKSNQPTNVDTTKTTTHVSLCAGYGGIDLGLSRAIPNLRTIAFSEIEAFACANLVAKMEAGLLDAAPIWTNLKTFPWSEFRDRVDILSGGYPCQPFSAAGKRLGRDDPRHLWPQIADGIVSMRPRICFFENVEGHISLGLREVISELESIGYQTTWGIFSAREVGAPHQRKRVFILAHRKSEGLERYDGLLARCYESRRDASEQEGQASWSNSCGNAWPSIPGQPQHEWEPPRVVGNSESIRSSTRRTEHEGLGGQLCTTSTGSEGAMGNSEGWQYHGRESRDMGNSTDERSSERRSREVPESRSKQKPKRSDASPERQAQPSLGLHTNESTYLLGKTLTLNPYGDSVITYENISNKINAREVLLNVWRDAISQEIQWTTRGLQCLLAEKVLQSGMQLDSFTQRICHFIWCIQTGHETKGWGLHGMWLYETCGDSPQGQKPIEQFKRELGYAMCQLSYEIALGGRKDAVETEGILQGVRESSERAWSLSQALPEMEEIWRSSLNQKVWENGCYIEASSIGNRTDELRLLGNGVVPATATRAFLTLMDQLLNENA